MTRWGALRSPWRILANHSRHDEAERPGPSRSSPTHRPSSRSAPSRGEEEPTTRPAPTQPAILAAWPLPPDRRGVQSHAGAAATVGLRASGQPADRAPAPSVARTPVGRAFASRPRPRAVRPPGARATRDRPAAARASGTAHSRPPARPRRRRVGDRAGRHRPRTAHTRHSSPRLAHRRRRAGSAGSRTAALPVAAAHTGRRSCARLLADDTPLGVRSPHVVRCDRDRADCDDIEQDEQHEDANQVPIYPSSPRY